MTDNRHSVEIGNDAQPRGHADGWPDHRPNALDGNGQPDDLASGDFTDLDNAERLAKKHGSRIRYCGAAGGWLVWTGRRWQSGDELGIEALAKETVRAMRQEVDDIRGKVDRYAHMQRALRVESKGRIRSMIHLARSEPGIKIEPEMLDRDPFLLNCLNGTLDLRSGELRPHDPADLITRLAPVSYRPDAKCPQWVRFLDRVCSGDPDLVQYLRQVAGYALTGDTREHCLFYLYGRGRNGKSVFLNTLQRLVGDYGITVRSELLTTRNRDQHPTELADLQGRRFVTTIEVEDGRQLAESLVKSLTGGDRIRARRLYRESNEFTPHFKLFIAANHKLAISGTDEGIWSRIRLIPFREVIPKQERDPLLMEKLRAEEEGILAWAVRGCLDWQRTRLDEPEAVRRATDEYRVESDQIGEFIDSCCILHPEAKTSAGLLYDRYALWCKESGQESIGRKAFSEALDEREFKKLKRSRNVRFGIQLRQDE